MADSFKPCYVEDCNGNASRRGFCRKHYSRFMRYGDPQAGKTARGAPRKFYHEVAILYKGDDCLIWPHERDGAGRGVINIEGRRRIVSRLVCQEINGFPPSDIHHAAHACGNGHLGCVSPRHLSWKTPKENAADKIIHGTHNRGERHTHAKLNEKQVREIISLKGKEKIAAIALQYGITKASVSLIHTGKTWYWLSDV